MVGFGTNSGPEKAPICRFALTQVILFFVPWPWAAKQRKSFNIIDLVACIGPLAKAVEDACHDQWQQTREANSKHPDRSNTQIAPTKDHSCPCARFVDLLSL
jgi:hypothetical protein